MNERTTPKARERIYGRTAQAWQLLTEWTQSESLRKHALAVEACVVACGEAEADRLGLTGDERAALVQLYSTTALLHDFDYERHPTPEEHPVCRSARTGAPGLAGGVADRDSGSRAVFGCASGDASG